MCELLLIKTDRYALLISNLTRLSGAGLVEHHCNALGKNHLIMTLIVLVSYCHSGK